MEKLELLEKTLHENNIKEITMSYFIDDDIQCIEYYIYNSDIKKYNISLRTIFDDEDVITDEINPSSINKIIKWIYTTIDDNNKTIKYIQIDGIKIDFN